MARKILIIFSVSCFFYVAVYLGLQMSSLWNWQVGEESGPEAGLSKKLVQQEKREDLSEPQTPIEVVRSLKHSKAKKIAFVKIAKAPKRGSVKKKNRVNFKVIRGMAVAHGDIILGLVKKDYRFESGVVEAQAVKLWPKAVIPYVIEQGMENEAVIMEAISLMSDQTPVKFVPWNGKGKSYLAIMAGEAPDLCLSKLGYQGDKGGQPIYLAPNCGRQEVLHELMHTLGFVHEHSRPDRDEWVEVVWDNVLDEFMGQFEMVPVQWMQRPMGSFDFKSVMIYDPYAFSISSNSPALRSLREGEQITPNKEGLSVGDIEKVTRAYSGAGDSGK